MNKFAIITGFALCLLGGMVSSMASTASTASTHSTHSTDSNPATEELLRRLQRITHLQGHFQQRQYGEDKGLLAESSGVFSLLRPVYFSWEIRSPDRQRIIANAEYLWHYDMDLQTVTRRPVVGNIEASPLQVLGGDESVLRERYTVAQDDADRFTLTPVTGQQGFKRLGVTFKGDTITGMDILDKLNQHVVVTFSELDAATPLTGGDFEFTPPPGEVDLFYYDE